MTTHKVVDLIYHEDEEGSNIAFMGTQRECEDFVADQGGFGFDIRLL